MKAPIFNIMVAAALAMGAAACSDDKYGAVPDFPETPQQPENPGTPAATASRDEMYRPQIHFTPAKNWTNDPNGMVYADGIYHLYYQYNPQGNSWGNMSWGHATSKDLIHWEEKGIAMTRNEWGDIFSGCAIVDKENVAGFGKNAILAFYTASGEHQQQCLAFSTDSGETFKQYEGNPVISNTELADFRDPKVIWHEESHRWIMCLALGWSHQIELWGSTDLKKWSKLSTFTTENSRCNVGQWECPDLIRLPYQGGEKWVLIVSNNPGGPIGGSGTEYFVGDFDGTTFTAMNLDYPLWLDYGADNYAGVTWNGIPDGRTVMIGWMNNWNYAGDVPCDPWRSAMTLPRQLTLQEVNGSPLLASKVVDEIDAIAGEWTDAPDGVINAKDAYEATFTIDAASKTSFRLENSQGQYMEVEVSPIAQRIIVKRTSTTGEVKFNNLFALPGISAPLHNVGDNVELRVFVDRSSVEIFTANGTTCLTNIVFPKECYHKISGVENLKYRALSSIW